MQEAPGANFTDLIRSARPLSVDIGANRHLHFSPKSLFASLIQIGAGFAVALAISCARRLRFRAGGAPHFIFRNMMADYLCVCHWQLQNEVIGG